MPKKEETGLYYESIKNIFNEYEPGKNVVCPFHDDHVPSMSIDDGSGLIYCFGCKWKGNIKKLLRELGEEPTPEKAIKETKGALQEAIQVQVQKDLEIYHQALLSKEVIMQNLLEERGWTKETIIKFKLGWNKFENRIWIPTFNKDKNKVISLKKYDVFKLTTGSKFAFLSGLGSSSVLYPCLPEDEEVWLMAGEGDTILANQIGLPAFTLVTGESSSFPSERIYELKDKAIYICYDIDDAGKKGAISIAGQLDGNCEVFFAVIPRPLEFNGKDFTDYYLFKKGELNPYEEFKIIDYKSTKVVKTIHQASLAESSVPMLVEGIINAISTQPYRYPKEVTVNCGAISKEDRDCEKCTMAFVPDRTKDLSYSCARFIGIKDQEKAKRIRQYMGVKCDKAFRVLTEGTLEQIFIMPDLSASGDRHVMRRAVVKSKEPLELNKKYLFSGRVASDPQDQSFLFSFDKADPVEEVLTTFQLKRKRIEELRRVYKMENAIYNPLKTYISIVKGLEDITKMKDRIDLHSVIDLTFFSPLSFVYKDRIIKKGYMEAAIAGDTKTGKTESIEALHEYYLNGKYIACEKTTFAGLIGGQDRIPRLGSVMTWGELPQCDRKEMTLDECQGLSESDLKNMSSVRSSGIAERTIVGGTRKTYCRVRLVWIGNPRRHSRVKDYMHGPEMILELFGGRYEDVSRLDIATIVSTGSEVKQDVSPIHIPKDLIREQLIWAWSRKSENIVITGDAYNEIERSKTYLLDKYGITFPLMGPYYEIKLTKMACALAMRLFSTTTGRDVVVEDTHVLAIRQIVDAIYSKRDFGYDVYAKLQKKIVPTGMEKEEVARLISKMDKARARQMVTSLLSVPYFSVHDFREMIGEKSEIPARELRTALIERKMLQWTGKSTLKPTPEFYNMLKKMLDYF